ncbi:hypothetical protein RBB50_012820 [Rhinocladiella similis]
MHLKASEQFLDRLVSRYIGTKADLARPDLGFDATDPNRRSTNGFVPRSSRDRDGLWIGGVVLPRKTGVCEVVLSNSPGPSQVPTHGEVIDPDMVVVNNLAQDSRFCTRPYVCSEPRIRFYAGTPIRATDGTRIGVSYVFDVISREDLTRKGNIFMCDTAKTIMDHLKAAHIPSDSQCRDQLVAGLEYFVSGRSEHSATPHDAPESGQPGDQLPDHASRGEEIPDVPPASHRSAMSATRLVSMWEMALPSGCRGMFPMAANIVRSSGQDDGVALF